MIDVDAEVAPEMTTDHTAAIAEAIRQQMTAQFDGVQEVEVHFEPARTIQPDYALTARARADALGLSTHAVRVSASDDGKQLEMHVEVPAGQTLGEAHEQVTQLEQAMVAAFPDLTAVVTHIEPADPAPAAVEPALPALDLAAQAATLLRQHFPLVGWHDIQAAVGEDGEGCAITAHAAMPADIALADAHLAAEAAERMLRAELPALQRVTIHTEPVGM